MRRGKFEAARKRLPLWYTCLLLLLIALFCGCGWYLADYYMGSRRQAQAFGDLAATVDNLRPPVRKPTQESPTTAEEDADTPPVQPDTPPLYEDLCNEDGILLEYAALHEQNPDMAGWLSIPGTRINYPVMHTPDRTDYYLKRDFEGTFSNWGCLYAREECSITEPSDNVTIYGHNMKDGSMFAGLHAYTSRDFWEEHRYICFDTLTAHHTYEIFAVFTTTASEGMGFAYHDLINAATQEVFDTFVAKCLSLSLYGTELVPVYGDKIICLSTCEYSQTNGRLVVAAARIQ